LFETKHYYLRKVFIKNKTKQNSTVIDKKDGTLLLLKM